MLWSFVKEDITPPIGLWQDGYANRPHGSDGVLDPLSLRVAVAKSGDSAVVFIAIETLVLIDTFVDEMKIKISKACGIERYRILAAATHTHGAPMSQPTENEEEYEHWWQSVSDKAMGAVQKAINGLQQASFDTVSGLSRIGINRREFTEKGVMLGENPKAVIDRNLRMLRVFSGDGKLLGTILQGACHAVCMQSKNTKYTGDWPGRACRLLEEQNEGTVMLYFNGGCGDVNPKRYEGESDEECLNRTVTIILEDTAALLKKPFVPHDDGQIACADSVFDVPLRKIDKKELSETLEEWRKRMAIAPDDSWDKIIGIYCGRFTENAAQHLDSGKPLVVKAVLQTVRLAGDISFMVLPFETFSATSRGLMLSLKEQGLGKENAFIIGYANGIHGYLPTVKAIREGGYEPVISAWFYNLPSYYSPRAEREVRNRLLSLWEETKTVE